MIYRIFVIGDFDGFIYIPLPPLLLQMVRQHVSPRADADAKIHTAAPENGEERVNDEVL